MMTSKTTRCEGKREERGGVRRGVDGQKEGFLGCPSARLYLIRSGLACKGVEGVDITAWSS